MFRNYQELPSGEAAEHSEAEEGRSRQLFTHILRRIRTMYHFAPRFPVSFCIPPPSFAPASRGTFPQGKVLAVRDSYESQRRNKKSLAEFADGSRQIKSSHFPSGRVPDGKYISGCKCASCSPTANNSCAQQTAKVCRKSPQGVFRQSELPLWEAVLRSKTEEGRSRQLFHAHSAANPYNAPFCPGYLNESLHPAALFRPGKPGHLPPREGFGGSLWLIPFNGGRTEQRCASGRMISSPTGGGGF